MRAKPIWSRDCFMRLCLLGLAFLGLQPATAQDDLFGPAEMSDQQLTVVVDGLLKRVRKGGEFDGSGGAADSAYLYYHIVTYDAFSPSDDVVIHAHELQPAMTDRVLERMDNAPFPFHAIPILAELRKQKMANGLEQIIDDSEQPSVRRLICLFALVRAGEPLRTNCLLDILANDSVLAHRLIAILSLRYGGQQAMPILIKQLDDPNIEICTAAACALQDMAPEKAILKIDERVRESFAMPSPPLLLLGRYQDYDSEASRDLLTKLVRDIVDEKLACPFPDRVLSEFVAHCVGEPGSAIRQAPGSDKTKLKLALEMAERQKILRQQRRRQAAASLENAVEQLRVATEIEQLRLAEYKRLLALQGDDVVSPEQSEQARQALAAVRAEVELRQQALQTARLAQELPD